MNNEPLTCDELRSFGFALFEGELTAEERDEGRRLATKYVLVSRRYLGCEG